MSDCRIITLHQPWASLIALGYKRYETRSWKTSYRGRLLIHAAKRAVKDMELARIAYESIGHLEYSNLKKIDYPLGAIVADCNLTNCFQMKEARFKSYMIDINSVGWIETASGDWRVNRFAWKLSDVRACEPYPWKGAQGLLKIFPVPELSYLQAVTDAL